MSTIRTIIICSLDELHRRAADWDDLWKRSTQPTREGGSRGSEHNVAVLPLLRAGPLAAWVEQFSSDRRFEAVAVEQDGLLVAALPLVYRRVKRIIPIGALPNNEWSKHGDLLLDPAANDGAMDMLVKRLADSKAALLWFDSINPETVAWRAFRHSVRRAGLPHEVREQYRVGAVDIDKDFTRFTATLSRNFRRGMRRRIRNLKKVGSLEYQHVADVTPQDIEPLLAVAFQVEDQGWKGEAGTSVLRNDGMLAFFHRLARETGKHRELYVDFLRLDARPIAFELGYISQGVLFAHKIGYLQEFASHAPGHVLRWLQLEHLAGQCATRDCFGKLTEAAAKWSTRTYPVGRILLAPRNFAGRAIFSLYRRCMPLVRRVRREKSSSNAIHKPLKHPAVQPPANYQRRFQAPVECARDDSRPNT